MSALSEAQRFKQVQRVFQRTLAANIAVSTAKLIVGMLTGSLAMIADGFHSAMDASSNLIGMLAASIAAQPPDAEHPYGHRRFETLATLAIGGLLLVAAWEILTTAIDRLLHGGTIEVSPISFAVMLGTLMVNFGVVLYESSQARCLNSDVLRADVAHTRVDIFVSLSVILSLIFTELGIAWADTAVALLIVALIGRTAFAIVRQTSQVLADRAPLDPEAIQRVVASVPGVESVSRVRSRGPADAVYADVEVRVQPATTAERASAIADEIEARLKESLQGVTEVQVQVQPHYATPPDRATMVRAVADALGLAVHEVTEIVTGRGIALEMHVEVSPLLTLAAAHEQVSLFEARLRAAMPEVCEVITHIEPASRQADVVLHSGHAALLREQALQVARHAYPEAHWSDANVRTIAGGYAVMLRCTLSGEMSVQEAHAIAEQVEMRIRSEIPLVQRVTIHTEPA
ncbi:MAG: cation-efflux pump [Anaerolineae bacterium]|nr:cation-efflux pump [Anaerolineae bacterium]